MMRYGDPTSQFGIVLNIIDPIIMIDCRLVNTPNGILE